MRTGKRIDLPIHTNSLNPWPNTNAARSVFELASVITLPPAGAGVPRVTVACAAAPLPPATVAGGSGSNATVGPTYPAPSPLALAAAKAAELCLPSC